MLLWVWLKCCLRTDHLPSRFLWISNRAIFDPDKSLRILYITDKADFTWLLDNPQVVVIEVLIMIDLEVKATKQCLFRANKLWIELLLDIPAYKRGASAHQEMTMMEIKRYWLA